MSSRNVNDLLPELRQKALQVVDNCKERGANMLIYCTLRDLQDQARLFRQSRSTADIRRRMDELRSQGFGYLADVINDVGPQFGRMGQHVTNAVPGQSWHNLREAFDAVPVIDGVAQWNANHPHWAIYGEEAEKLGLNWGGSWENFIDKPHCQIRFGSNPLRTFSPSELRSLLKDINLL